MKSVESPPQVEPSSMAPVTGREDETVTLIMRRTVRPSHEQDFEAWLRGITEASATFPGYQGTNILRPRAPGREYVYIVRFDCYAHLIDWENSPARAAHVARLGELVEGDPSSQLMTGIEYWFSPPGAPLSAPPQRAKMAAVTTLAIYPLSLLASLSLAPALDVLPLLLREFVVAVVLVLLMTYLVMPKLTRLLRRWLMPV